MNPEQEWEESERLDDIKGLIVSARKGLTFAPVAYYRAFGTDAFDSTTYEQDVGIACAMVPWLAPAPETNNLCVRVTDSQACIDWLCETHGRELILSILMEMETGA